MEPEGTVRHDEYVPECLYPSFDLGYTFDVNL